MAKAYSATAVSLSCRIKRPLFSLGVGVGVPDDCLGGVDIPGDCPGGSALRSRLRLRPRAVCPIFSGVLLIVVWGADRGS